MIRSERWLTALGIARPGLVRRLVDKRSAHEPGQRVRVEGLPGWWLVDPVQLDLPFAGRTAVLSPLDWLVNDRKRLLELFDFDYQLEMYKPAARRRWGYWAMPVLHGDRLVGKVDAAADRAARVLRVSAVHEDVPFARDIRDGVAAELEALGTYLGLEVVS